MLQTHWSRLLALLAVIAASSYSLAQTAGRCGLADLHGTADTGETPAYWSDWLGLLEKGSAASVTALSPATSPAASPAADNLAGQTGGHGNGSDEATIDREFNSGEDFTRPLSRFDIRDFYQQTSGAVSENTLTLRVDAPFKFPSGWKISTRVDLPVVSNNKGSSDEDAYTTGLGDLLTQVLLITPHQDRFAFGAGTRFYWPTTTNDQLANDRYQPSPMAGFAYYPEFLREGSLLGAIARYQFSVGGGDSSKVSQLIIQPLVNINLPDEWFVNMQPEMVMNCEQDDAWFIPFDIMIGKKITPSTVLSVEYKQALIDEYDSYEFQLEFRIGFFF